MTMPVLWPVVPSQLTSSSNKLVELIWDNVWFYVLVVYKKSKIWCLIDHNSLHEEIWISAAVIEKSPKVAIIHRIDDQIEIFWFRICKISRFIETGQIKIVGNTANSCSFFNAPNRLKVSVSMGLLFRLFFRLILTFFLFVLCDQFAFIWFTRILLGFQIANILKPRRAETSFLDIWL